MADYLKYGAVGLCAILALLSYFLLQREQSKDNVRDNMVSTIYVFMAFSLVLAIMGFGSELYTSSVNTIHQEEIQAIENKHLELVQDYRQTLSNINTQMNSKVAIEKCVNSNSELLRNAIANIEAKLNQAAERGLFDNPEPIAVNC